jgi:hypothetical protein
MPVAIELERVLFCLHPRCMTCSIRWYKRMTYLVDVLRQLLLSLCSYFLSSLSLVLFRVESSSHLFSTLI